MLRSEGKDYGDNEHKQQYEDEQNNSQAYFENHKVTNATKRGYE